MKPTNSITFPKIDWLKVGKENLDNLNKYTPFHLLPWYYWLMLAVAAFLLFFLWFDYNYYSVD